MKVVVIGNDINAALALTGLGEASELRTDIDVAWLLPAVGATTTIDYPAPDELIEVGGSALRRLGPVNVAREAWAHSSAADWPAKVGERFEQVFPVFPQSVRVIPALRFLGHMLPRFAHIGRAWSAELNPIDAVLAAFEADLVINTYDRSAFCLKLDEHQFLARPEWTSEVIGPSLPDNHIAVNAGDAPAWYSSAHVERRKVTRWLVKPPFKAIEQVAVPLRTTCTCRADWLHLGRWATYTPATPLHGVYDAAMGAVLPLPKEPDVSLPEHTV